MTARDDGRPLPGDGDWTPVLEPEAEPDFSGYSEADPEIDDDRYPEPDVDVDD
ncbi:MAG TPA: hypothetical protein VF821_34345 [Lentzea sp.]